MTAVAISAIWIYLGVSDSSISYKKFWEQRTASL